MGSTPSQCRGVKDLALLELQLGFHLWPRHFHMWPKKERRKEGGKKGRRKEREKKGKKERLSGYSRERVIKLEADQGLGRRDFFSLPKQVVQDWL